MIRKVGARSGHVIKGRIRRLWEEKVKWDKVWSGGEERWSGEGNWDPRVGGSSQDSGEGTLVQRK